MIGAAGITSGIVILSAVSGGGFGMALAYLTPLPLLLIGLAFGLQGAAISALIGTGVVAMAGMAALPAFLVVGPLPALLVTWIALMRRRDKAGGSGTSDAGRIVLALTMGAILVMGLLVLTLPTGGLSIEAWLSSQAEKMVTLPGLSQEVKAALIGQWVLVMPAMVGTAWFAMTLVNGAIAQWAVSRAGHKQRSTPSFADLHLPIGVVAAAAVMAGLGFAGGTASGDWSYIARNAALLLLLPYLVAGVVDLHGFLRRKPNGALWLGLFYGVLFALSGLAVVAVTAWGVVRQYVRSRRPEPAQDQEDSDGSHSA
jgi:hypothetical protein